MLQEAGEEPYHYASLYSNSGTVLHYLVRLPPFTKMFLDYQDNNFDVPDRTFHSMSTSWLLSSSESTTDFKELIPEFFFLHEFLRNTQNFNFGLRQNGDSIDDVILPPWCKNNTRLFMMGMRQALESDYVSSSLQLWIDLIFGCKQNGKSAIEAINRYHPACYFGYPVEQISDLLQRRAIETMIKTWGQTPKKIFDYSHPSQYPLPVVKRATTATIKFPDDSIHSKIINVKWGSYVGSLDQPLPMCVSCQKGKNLSVLVCLPSNAVFGLSQSKCILLKRYKDTGRLFSINPRKRLYLLIVLFIGFKFNESSEKIHVIQWAGFCDDYFHIRYEKDKPSSKLMVKNSNENVRIIYAYKVFRFILSHLFRISYAVRVSDQNTL
jgi:lysosomal-trafficking regulator